MHHYLIDMLQCPACSGALIWDIAEENTSRIIEAEARCRACSTSYPVHEGIGVFLTPDMPRQDLWDEVDSQLSQYLSEHPQIEQKLMKTPLEELNPADQFFRAMILEERGALAQAKMIYMRADAGLYSPEYQICHESQVHFLIDHLSGSADPVIDIASGRADLVQVMLKESDRPIVATDFSPRILRRDRRWLEFQGRYDRLSLLAFDARKTPFKNGSVQTMTTNLGLMNIRQPGDLLKELRRTVRGEFMAITSFYPAEDEVNQKIIAELDLEGMLYRANAFRYFADAGWKMLPENACQGAARPTPSSLILEGAGIDTLPAGPTELEWATLVAR